jgi:hypothetical protein
MRCHENCGASTQFCLFTQATRADGPLYRDRLFLRKFVFLQNSGCFVVEQDVILVARSERELNLMDMASFIALLHNFAS